MFSFKNISLDEVYSAIFMLSNSVSIDGFCLISKILGPYYTQRVARDGNHAGARVTPLYIATPTHFIWKKERTVIANVFIGIQSVNAWT